MAKNNIDNASAWESYWSTTALKSAPILWNCEPTFAAAIDLPRFLDLMDRDLPLIDFGCGDGNQTRFLANHFPRVMGVDVSPSAVALAQVNNNAPNVEYRVLDALLLEQAAALHSEIGNANIYTRGAMHQLDWEQRTLFARSLEVLVGKEGIIYLIDIGSKANSYFASLVQMYAGKLPKELERVLKSGISKGSVTREDIATIFPSFEVLADGEDVIHTIHILPNGENAKVPAYYALLRQARDRS
jgi:trans-aconitate methyltransferase